MNERVDVERCAEIARRALEQGLFEDPDSGHEALLFHDLDMMRRRLGVFQAHFPPQTLHAVAVKANPVVSILKELVQAGAGLECASIEEVHLSLAAGAEPQNIVFDSPAKTNAELAQALERGLHLNTDNFDELGRIEALMAQRQTPSAAVIGVRVNPQVGAGKIAATSVGARVSKFGLPLDASRQEIVDAFGRWPWLTALHIHVGSQGCSLEQLILGAERLMVLVEEIEAAHGQGRVTHLDIGGGLPVIYRTGFKPPTVAKYVEKLTEAVPQLMSGRYRLLTEFGRSIHAGCGFAVSRVEYVKRHGDAQMAVVHLGADFLMRPVYNPQDWFHEFALLDAQGHPKEGDGGAWSVVGPLCFGGDIIGRQVPLPKVEVGDWIVIRDTGAYTLGMWSRHCSRGQPAVIGVEGDVLRTLRKRESPADMVRYWS